MGAYERLRCALPGEQLVHPLQDNRQPFQGATGQSTALHDSIFTTIPGSPAFVGKADDYKVTAPQHGFEIDLHDHNAVQGSFRFAA